MKRSILLLPVACCLIVGCREQAAYEVSPDDPNVVYVEGDDPEMQAAMAEAKRTVDEFIGHWNKRSPDKEMFAVKKPYPTRGGSLEHIWIDVTDYRDGVFFGTIANEPMDIEGISLGSQASVPKTEISDWMVMTETGMLGGYTYAVQSKRTGG